MAQVVMRRDDVNWIFDLGYKDEEQQNHTLTTTMLAVRSLSRLSTKSSATLNPISRQLRPLTRRLPPAFSGTGSIAIRGAASQVANRPGSQSIPHAAQNIKEEVGHAIEDSEYKSETQSNGSLI